MFERVITHIGDSVGAWLYLIAAAFAFSEAAILVGMVLPGETALLVAGVFCHTGTLKLYWMIPIAIVAAIAGDSVGYEFGRTFGPRLRGSGLGRWVGEHRWAVVDGFIHRHGGKAVFLGRLTALLRALLPSMAGMSRMPYRTFLFWNALGGTIWATSCVFLGYFFYGALSTVGKSLTWGPLAILAVLAAGYLVVHMRRRTTQRREAAAFAAADAQAFDTDGNRP